MTDDFGGADMTDRNLVDEIYAQWDFTNPLTAIDPREMLVQLARQCAEVAYESKVGCMGAPTSCHIHVRDEILRRCGLSEEGK